ncbi:MAG: sulfotransferase family protein [Desulfobulbus sp.]|nr:MAG: sulfotransferase family protein [Desulfobulbus sp.]
MNKRKLLRRKTGGKKGQDRAADQKREIGRMLTLATRALEARQPGVADDWCRQVLALAPANSNALNLRGLAAAQLGRSGAAERFFRAALAGQPDNPAFNCNLGILLANLGNSTEALPCFEQALRLQPDNVEILYNLIELYEKTNQLPLAREKAKHALLLAPDHPPLRYQLAKLEYRLGSCQTAGEIIADLLERNLDHDLTQKIFHLRGQVCDRLGEYDRAFAAFQQANELLALTPLAGALAPRRTELLNFIERQQGIFRRERIREWLPAASDEQGLAPVFLIGFPRSGTTLAGQLLAAHSRVITLEEQPTLAQLIAEFSSPERLALLADLAPAAIAAVRENYRRLLRELAGPGTSNAIIVDKNPFYICYLGLIRRFFPKAKVIVVHRDPRDVCLSNFMQDFTLTPFLLNFLTLEQTVSFYHAVMTNFFHFREHLNLAILEIRYDDLIGDYRAETEKILSFLGLEWEDGIDSFHEQAGERFIRTPSYQQVVQPVYTSARGRWQNYVHHLSPFLDRLRPHLLALGYR